MEKARHIIPEPEMKTQNLFNFLPSEIIASILSKIPVPTISICKCVCKSWLHLIETQAFTKLHLSTSVPGLVTFRRLSELFNIFEFEDGHDVERHGHHYNLCTRFWFPHSLWMHGSVDGLLWLSDRSAPTEAGAISISFFICNPITRDYIKIQNSLEFPCTTRTTFGFGSCKMTGQYKVVMILLNGSCREQMSSTVECYVYTLGTGSRWRKLAHCAPQCVTPQTTHPGAFVNGSLHWLGDQSWISCFDLETESFSTFSAPSSRGPLLLEHFALEENLCLYERTLEDKIVIWSMEEYGNAKSWEKKLVIDNCTFSGLCHVYQLQPLKVFKDGDILMEINDGMLCYYSNKTKSTQQVDMFSVNLAYARYLPGMIRAVVHTPSFRSLKSLRLENVISF